MGVDARASSMCAVQTDRAVSSSVSAVGAWLPCIDLRLVIQPRQTILHLYTQACSWWRAPLGGVR